MDGMSGWGAANSSNSAGAGPSRRQSEEATGTSTSAARRSPQLEDSGIPSLEDVEAPLPPTAAGERDRSPADILRDSPETRAFINEINRYTTLRPFLLIMLLKVI
jgi:hypothetical protein